MQNNDINKNQLDKKDLLMVFLLCISGIVLTYHLEQYMDVLLWDEAIYLDRGFLLWKIIPNTWGPIYSVWYKLLSYIEINKINLYYLNFKIQTISSTCLLYFMLRRYSINIFIAFLLSIIWLHHSYNLPAWPKISHFSIQLVLLAAIFASYFSSYLIKTIIFSIAFLFCGYARPELYLSFLMSLCLVIYFLVKERKSINLPKIVSLAMLVALTLLTYKLYRTPFNNNDSQRSVGVLIQHLAYNITTWNQQDLLWWYEWKSIISQYLDEPFRLKDIVFNSDGIFLKHILYNIKMLIISISNIVVSIFVPYSFFSKRLIFTILISITFLLIFYSNRIIKSITIKKHRYILLMFVIACLPSISSSIYAYPRTHYLIMLIPLLWLLVAIFINSSTLNIKYCVLIFLIFLAFAPKAKDYVYFDMFGTHQGMTNVKTINYIQEKYKSDTICIFDADGMLPTLMPKNYIVYDFKSLIADEKIYFSDLMQQKQPDLIFVSPTMMKWTKLKDDTLFINLIKQPESYLYKRENIVGVDNAYLLVKE